MFIEMFLNGGHLGACENPHREFREDDGEDIGSIFVELQLTTDESLSNSFSARRGTRQVRPRFSDRVKQSAVRTPQPGQPQLGKCS